MSWSVSAKGKPSEVGPAIAKQFAGSSKCVEPEETIRQAVSDLLATAITAESSDANLEVSAYGSQFGTPEKPVNSLNVSIKAIY